MASGLALPTDNDSFGTIAQRSSKTETFALSNLVAREDDDEWEYILYDAAKSGDQCGGAVTVDTTGVASAACATLAKAAQCVSVKAGANLGWMYCDLVFQPGSCGGSEGSGTLVTIEPNGTSTVNAPDVKFVTVTCIANDTKKA